MDSQKTSTDSSAVEKNPNFRREAMKIVVWQARNWPANLDQWGGQGF